MSVDWGLVLAVFAAIVGTAALFYPEWRKWRNP